MVQSRPMKKILMLTRVESQAFTAMKAGADYLKLFPAGIVGPGYVKDLKAVVSKPIIAVGGVNAENIPAFMQVCAGVGIPTINQEFPPQFILPRFGVYAVRMTVDGKIYHGVANVGVRPTVERTDAVNCETYLLDFRGDLYGKTVKTEFLHFLREEQRFESVAALKTAVDHNILQAKAYFEAQKERRQ